jgi:hypothetical protein
MGVTATNQQKLQRLSVARQIHPLMGGARQYLDGRAALGATVLRAGYVPYLGRPAFLNEAYVVRSARQAGPKQISGNGLPPTVGCGNCWIDRTADRAGHRLWSYSRR